MADPLAPLFLATPVRQRALEFLMDASLRLAVAPVVKYTALSLFADRFLPSLPGLLGKNAARGWLLQPLRESNVHLFTLISLWISSKLHDTCPLSSKSLKALGDRHIRDQHFTLRDFVEAELIFLEIAAYVLTVKKQQWEFPLLPWARFATSCEEDSIADLVKRILEHLLIPTVLESRTGTTTLP